MKTPPGRNWVTATVTVGILGLWPSCPCTPGPGAADRHHGDTPDRASNTHLRDHESFGHTSTADGMAAPHDAGLLRWYGRPGLSGRSSAENEPTMRRLLEVGGKRAPFLRWSALRMAFGMRHLMREWQVGDGREDALADYVLAHARRGDVSDAIRARWMSSATSAAS